MAKCLISCVSLFIAIKEIEMEFILDFVLHIDRYMVEIVRDYHTWTYAILFLIIFCETGLVVTPFLPGDSLLFVAGAIAAQPDMPLNVHILALVVFGEEVDPAHCGVERSHTQTTCY